MKNSHTVILVLISVAATVIYMGSERRKDIRQTEEVTSKVITVKNSMSPTVAEPPAATELLKKNKKVFIKLNEDKLASTTFDLGKKTNKPSFITGESKALDSKVVNQQLEVADFQNVISSLIEFQTPEEIEREYELAQAINEEPNLSAYPYSYSCGSGVCAVEISNITNEELVNVSQLISGTTNFKALTIHTIAELDGTNSIRVIGGSSPETNSITVDLSYMNISNLE